MSKIILTFNFFTNRFNENKPVTSSRDTQEIHPAAGAEMLRTFKEYSYESSILDDFNFYEKRQDKLSTNRLNQNNKTVSNCDDSEKTPNYSSQNFNNLNQLNYSQIDEKPINLNDANNNFNTISKNEKCFEIFQNKSNLSSNSKTIKTFNSIQPEEKNELTNERNFFVNKINDKSINYYPINNSLDKTEESLGFTMEYVNGNNSNKNNKFENISENQISKDNKNKHNKKIIKRINSTDNILKSINSDY
jgi:hypothetical protein